VRIVQVSGEEQGNIPDFGRKAGGALGQGERSGTSRSSPPARARPGRRHTSAEAGASVLKSPGGDGVPQLVASGHWPGSSSSTIGSSHWMDRRAARGTLGPMPQFQVAQDLLNDRGVSDQADNLERSGAAGTDQVICFVHFLDPPSPADARRPVHRIRSSSFALAY